MRATCQIGLVILELQFQQTAVSLRCSIRIMDRTPSFRLHTLMHRLGFRRVGLAVDQARRHQLRIAGTGYASATDPVGRAYRLNFMLFQKLET